MKWRRWMYGGLVGLGCLLLGGGCGGQGNPSMGRMQQLASRHVTAVVQVKRWTDILYRLFGLPSGPCEQKMDYEELPDGSFVIHITNSDCSTGEFVQKADSSGYGVTTFSDGTQESVWWDVPEMTATSASVSIRYLFRDQARMEVTETVDNGGTELFPDDDTVRRVGRFELPEGQSLSFFYERRLHVDHLRLEQSDGLVITLQIPLDPTEVAPDFSQSAAGTVEADGKAVLHFELRAVASPAGPWDSWSFTTPLGETGQFSITSSFEGSGQVQQPGVGQSAWSWNKEGRAVLTFTDGTHLRASPSQAALDFIVDQWLRRFGEYGPAPY